ncbi:LytTr DNA-binding domain protein [compost metagenome]
MSTLSVTSDIAGNSGFINVPINKVWYLVHSSSANRIVVHTRDQEYYLMGPLSYWTFVINNTGFRFTEGDRSASVNLDNVVRVNEVFKMAYFDDGKNGCMLSSKGYAELKKQLEVMNKDVVFG